VPRVPGADRLKRLALRAARATAGRFGYLVVDWPGPGGRRDLRGALAAAGIDHVLDVGAYDGEFALDLRRLGYQGRITSFEPSPEQLERLRSRSAADPRWTVVELALSSAPGRAALHRCADGHFDSLHQGRSRGGRFTSHLEHRDDVEVTTARLDAVWDEHVPTGARVLVKVDTQGHDLEVLVGMGERLREVAVLQCELAVIPLYDGAAGLREVLGHLEAEGFSLAGAEAVSRGPDHTTVLEFDCLFVNRRVAPFDWAGPYAAESPDQLR
jgi:FkbM family methyltransferase